MERSSTRDAIASLFLGPGHRLAELLPAMTAWAQAADGPQVRRLSDPLDLLAVGGRGPSRVLLDADAIEPEDLGLVRRFRDLRPEWELLVTGADEGARTAKAIVALGGRWMGWPLDVDQLSGTLAGASKTSDWTFDEGQSPEVDEAEELTDGEEHRPLEHHHLRDLEDDLEAIEEILAQEEEDPLLESGEFDVDPRELDLTPEEIDAFFSEPLEPGSAQEEAGGPAVAFAPAPPQVETALAPHPAAPWAPPAWYKDQVADLADRVQCLHLAWSAVGEGAEELQGDVLGLTQFARTLGFLAAPPGPGTQDVELGTLLEELLTNLAGAGPDSPRYLIRRSADGHVLSEKTLLVSAFDALLHLADACAGSEDVVRVSLDGDDDELQVDITFPAGALEDLPVESLLAPYAIHRRLPTMGPNAMAAAGRILQGQGGDLSVGEGDPGELIVRATLPRA